MTTNKEKKEQQVQDIVNSIMEDMYNYKDMIRDFVEFGVNRWSAQERKDWITPV